MSQTEPVAELNESFSEPGASAPPWTEVAAVLTASEMFWLSTVRRRRAAARRPAARDLAGRNAALLHRLP